LKFFEIELESDRSKGWGAMATRQYRPEIDGLRAVSVIGVVLFHLGLGFPGGFVGVDVFFVISGYLITGILLRQLSQDRFSLVDFWARRIRRIAPAAIAMVIGTLLIGGYLQTPERYAGLARSAMAHVVMASNCYFTRDAGYFAESSDFEPLLHTWSLSVEEQFYLIFPLLVLFAWRRWPEKIAWIMVASAVVSLGWSSLEVPRDPKEAFFLLPSRGWELLAGAIMAALPRPQMKRAGSEVLSALGLILVMVPMWIYDRETAFPGPAALPPVLGAVMLLCAGGATYAGRILSWRPLVGVGLISYSLYLWHWPLVVFAREVTFELTVAWKFSLLAASTVIAWLSWRWIETPFRSGGVLGTNARALRFGAISAAGLFAIALGIKLSGGFPSRLPEDLRVIMADVAWNGGDYTSSKSEASAIGERKEGSVDFVVWGDSHGASAAPAIDAAGQKLGLRGRAYLNNGTPPVTGLWFADMDREGAAAMVAMNERVLSEIIKTRPKVVILVGRWVARCEGYNEVEMVGEPESHRYTTMVVDSMIPAPTFAESSTALIRQLQKMNEHLVKNGIELLLVQQVPESTVGRIAARFYLKERFPRFSDLPQFTTTREDHRKRQARTMKTLADLSKEDITIVDPTNQFFKESNALQVYANRSFYRDDDHLTWAGSLHYLEPVFEKIMRRIPRVKSQ
jgi:peptidoglycan/LPS O-acetylase OafA/YrhL